MSSCHLSPIVLKSIQQFRLRKEDDREAAIMFSANNLCGFSSESGMLQCYENIS